jgi:hypothetical protein
MKLALIPAVTSMLVVFWIVRSVATKLRRPDLSVLIVVPVAYALSVLLAKWTYPGPWSQWLVINGEAAVIAVIVDVWWHRRRATKESIGGTSAPTAIDGTPKQD